MRSRVDFGTVKSSIIEAELLMSVLFQSECKQMFSLEVTGKLSGFEVIDFEIREKEKTKVFIWRSKVIKAGSESNTNFGRIYTMYTGKGQNTR